MREIVEATGATVLYLPPHSPDLNPIEQMWSKINAFLRTVKARTVDALEKAIPAAFQSVSVDDILNWFAFTGYWRYFVKML